MKEKLALFIAALGAAAVLSSIAVLPMSTATAQTDNQESRGAELAGPDSIFVAKALVAGLGEVQMSQLAAAHAVNPEIKLFAERIVADHTALNTQLAAMAEEHKLDEEGTKGTPPLKVSEEDTEAHEGLAKLSGSEFDKAYIGHMVEKHRADITLFREEIEEGKSDEIKVFAEATLPALEEHLQQAEALASQP